MKRIMSCLALVTLALFTSAAFAQDPTPVQQPASAQDPTPVQQPAPAQEPTLTSVGAKFDTTTDDKNSDSKLDVYIKTSDGQEVAKSEGNAGRWNNNSTHTLTLQVEGNPTKGAVANGSVTLTFHPHGADKWEFNYKVTLKFSDDSFLTKEFNGCTLTQHDPGRTDSL